MKICIVFEGRVRPDSTGFYFLSAFKSLGHTVDHFQPSEQDAIKSDYDLYFKCDDGIESGWRKELHPSIYYCIDTHIDPEWRIKLSKEGEFDLVCLAQKDGLTLPWENKHVMWVPLGCDPDVHYAGVQEKKYDVAVIMNFHSRFASRRIEYVHRLLANFPNFFFGNRTYKEMSQKFAESTLVFNNALNKDVNMRFFEGLCSGSVLLTDKIDSIDELGFVDGIHYVGYTDMDDMVSKAKEALLNKDKLDSIRNAGRDLVVKEHTYKHRCEKILQEIK